MHLSISLNITQSFSRAHVPYDNSVMESFFSSMKREELYRTKYRSEADFRNAVDKYITFYNTKRPHKKLKYKTPQQKEEENSSNKRIFKTLINRLKSSKMLFSIFYCFSLFSVFRSSSQKENAAIKSHINT